MAREIKGLAANFDDLSSIPGTYMVVLCAIILGDIKKCLLTLDKELIY